MKRNPIHLLIIALILASIPVDFWSSMKITDPISRGFHLIYNVIMTLGELFLIYYIYTTFLSGKPRVISKFRLIWVALLWGTGLFIIHVGVAVSNFLSGNIIWSLEAIMLIMMISFMGILSNLLFRKHAE